MGIELDMSKYAEQGFDKFQIEEIRKGLEQELDVSFYAKPEFCSLQMKEIRKGLEKGLDISVYAKPEFSAGNAYELYYDNQMREIRKGLEKGLDISVYANQFDGSQMREIRKGLEKGLDINVYANQFDGSQMREIRKGLEKGFDVSIYADPEFNVDQMRLIRKGLEKGFDVSIYADPEFNVNQMRLIRKGLEKGFDVSIYADPKFESYIISDSFCGADTYESSSQMDKIVEGLEQGLNVGVYANPVFKEYYYAEWDGYYKYNENENCQMTEIMKGLEKGLDVSVYTNPEFHASQMREIRKGLENGLDVSSYAKPELSASEMKEIREVLERQVEVSSVEEFPKTLDVEFLEDISDACGDLLDLGFNNFGDGEFVIGEENTSEIDLKDKVLGADEAFALDWYKNEEGYSKLGQVVHDLKYNKIQRYKNLFENQVWPLSRELAQHVRERGVDLILPVPSYNPKTKDNPTGNEKLMYRVVEELSKDTNIPYSFDILVKNTDKQAKNEDLKTNDFEVKELPGDLRNAHICIVDDLFQSGKSASSVIHLLKEKNPDVKVTFISLTRNKFGGIPKVYECSILLDREIGKASNGRNYLKASFTIENQMNYVNIFENNPNYNKALEIYNQKDSNNNKILLELTKNDDYWKVSDKII